MTTEGPLGWSFEFDVSDDHCAAYVEGELSSPLPDALQQALTAFADGGSREELQTHLDEQLRLLAEDAAHRAAYEELELVLTRHGEHCGCSQWAWDAEQDYLEQLLSEIEECSWFLSHGSETEWDLLQEALEYKVLGQLLGRHGWYHLRVVWDPAAGLRIDTDTQRVVLVAASDERLALSEAASEIGHWDHLALAKMMPEPHLDLALVLADEWVASGVYLDRDEAAARFSLPAALSPLETSEREIASALAKNWDGSLSELIEAARALVHA